MRKDRLKLLCPGVETVGTIRPLLYPPPPITLPPIQRFFLFSFRNHRFNISMSRRNLLVLLRIKISGKSYGRLQTNRAVAFLQGVETLVRPVNFSTLLLIFFPHLTSLLILSKFYTSSMKEKKFFFFLIFLFSTRIINYS